jgi:hypothetical protein
MGEGNAPIDGKGHLLIMAVGAAVAALASVGLMTRGCAYVTAARSSPAAPSPP